MAKEITLNTLIQLRNDTAENWTAAGENAKLQKGEAAVEIKNGKAKVKVGVSDNQAFADAPYIGGEDAQLFITTTPLAHNDTQDDVEDVIPTLIPEGTEVHEGDIAIVKRYISGKENTSNPISYTSYVYSNGVWQACDGNYSARNVFFNNDITLAGDYTAVGNVTKSKTETKTLSAAGQSLEDVMQSIFTKELNTGLKTANPGASISSFTEYIEIGSSTSKSTTVSLSSDGEYAYGYSTDPVDPAEGTVVSTVKNDKTTGVVVDTSKTSPYSVVFNGETKESATATFTLTTPVKTAKAEMTATGKVYYTQGGVPVSNLKKAYPAQRIAASQATSGASSVFRWYVPYYQGFIYGFDNKLDAVDVSKLTKVTGSTAFGANASTAPVKPTRATATGSWMQYWLVVPKSYNWKMSGAKDSNGLTLDVATKDNIKITYGTGDNAVEVEYNVYVISHDAAYDTTGISWS